MSDPIERQVAIVALRESRLARNPVYMTTAMQVIEKLPPAQPERKKGKWIEDHCSECGCYVYHGDVRNFCPNCGSYNGGDDHDL